MLVMRHEWAMPSDRTFKIKPIRELVEREVDRGGCNS